ncbi:hypothetical protein GGP55_002939 [Salinibacter ruber]|mgnify:FL=1|jgi:hypothetical protein|uniref:DUF1788 domain-containing protein n=1 Tax=Salinibacter ruber TaxID=146919 RepID=UPI0021687305|nr:DUF1788 domain-containing protein [Salinibacter ruber]MCS3632323.1 hypothetical protein [Salinibacter ruber]
MLDDVFEILADPGFQKPGSALMSFPAYVYVYPPDQEYEFREALPRLQKRLRRTNVGQNPLIKNIYSALLTHLEEKTLGGRPLLDRILEQEDESPDKVDRQLRRHAQSDAFIERVASEFTRFTEEEGELDRSYVFVHGWGAIHPYLRSSTFLDLMEPHLRGYKLIVFYPGTYKDGKFRLFGRLASGQVYRASCLNERIAS